MSIRQRRADRDYLLRVLECSRKSAPANEDEPQFPWPAVRAAARRLAEVQSADANELFIEFLDEGLSLPIDPNHHLPHCMSPEDSLRAIALRGLLLHGTQQQRDQAIELCRRSAEPRLAAFCRRYSDVPAGSAAR